MGYLMQETLFDLEEIEQINQQLIAEEHERKNLEARKNIIPLLQYFDNPKDDNERLLNYQYLYLKNNDMDAWGKLIELSFIVTKRLIWQWMKQNKKAMDDIEQDEKTSIAVEYVLRRYTKNIGYYIQKNYISALKGGVKHATLYTTMIDKSTLYIEDVLGSNNNWDGENET